MIRVGIIGAGFMGRNHFNQYEKLGARAKVVALCDQEADRRAGDWSQVGGNVGDKQGAKQNLAGIRPYTRFEDLIADKEVDMVDICTPTFTHLDMTAKALAAGKHVLCEKPMALNVADCDAMIAAEKRSKCKLMIAQCVRFWPEYVYLKELISKQPYGKLTALHLRRQSEPPTYSLNSWLMNPQLSGGAVLDLHIHDVDYAIHALGKPQAVYAQGRLGATGLDRLHAAWQYAGVPVVQIEGFWDMPTGFGFNMGFSARFEDAAVVWDLNTGKPLTCYQRDHEPATPAMPSQEDGYYGEIEYFIGCLERGVAPTATTPQESRDAVAIALLEKKSVESGEKVVVA